MCKITRGYESYEVLELDFWGWHKGLHCLATYMNSKVIAQLAKQHNKAKHKRKHEQKAKKNKKCVCMTINQLLQSLTLYSLKLKTTKL
jgi:hypothetical protein